jgi:hypothetical protein
MISILSLNYSLHIFKKIFQMYAVFHRFKDHSPFQRSLFKHLRSPKNLQMRNIKRRTGSEIDGMFAPFQKFMEWLRFYYAIDNYHFPRSGKVFRPL